MNLEHLGAIQLAAHALADHMGGGKEIFQGGVEDGGQSMGTGSLLTVLSSFELSVDLSLDNEEDLLLELLL